MRGKTAFLIRRSKFTGQDEGVIRRHAEISGFPATKITEIRKTIDPTSEREAD